MGGICAFGVRFSDGSLRFGDVYTNAMPIYVEHPKMLDDPDGWMRSYLDLAGRSEWNAKPIKRARCTGYGIVFVDIPTRQIVTHQDYTYFNSFGHAGLCLSARGNVHVDQRDDGVSLQPIDSFLEFVRRGLVPMVHRVWDLVTDDTFSAPVAQVFPEGHPNRGYFTGETAPYARCRETGHPLCLTWAMFDCPNGFTVRNHRTQGSAIGALVDLGIPTTGKVGRLRDVYVSHQGVPGPRTKGGGVTNEGMIEATLALLLAERPDLFDDHGNLRREAVGLVSEEVSKHFGRKPSDLNHETIGTYSKVLRPVVAWMDPARGREMIREIPRDYVVKFLSSSVTTPFRFPDGLVADPKDMFFFWRRA